MNIKPVFELLMWDNCNNNCKFCYQKLKYNPLSELEKQNAIDKAIAFLESDQFVKGSHLLLVGGELFDTPRTFEHLYRLIDYVLDGMVCGNVDMFYINTNLIYKKLDGVLYLMDRVNQLDLFDRLKFTSSYDKQGRYQTQKAHDLMLSNLSTLTTNYPKLRTVVNSMLSKQVCAEIINGEYSVSDFMNRYRCDVNLIPYIILNDDITASRSSIFKALKKVDQEVPGYLNRYVYNLNLPQDKLLYRYDKDTEQFQFCSCQNSECGHSENFKMYSKAGTCFVCDLKMVFGY